MKTLSLLRHGKSDWSDRSMRDFDRPVNERGIKGSRLMGEFAAGKGLVFDHVLASPALRVTETIDHFEQGYGQSLKVDWDKRIYLASSVTLIDLLREVDDSKNAILMVGHNPGLEDLIFDLVPENADDPLRAIVEDKFPTATFAQMELEIGHWDMLENHCARLSMIKRPRDLDPALGPEMD